MDIEQIKALINEFKESFLPDDWIWRRGQQEAIIQIIQTYYEGKHKTVILDSPVGSGKSIIAMCCSWIFNQSSKKCYILASDVALQDQYEKDFKKFNLYYGRVSGIDNYTCIDNMEKHSLGTCKIRGINPRKMSCYSECPYFKARDEASSSPTSLLNYAYWLISQNYVNKHISDPFFPPRPINFCDEGHKVLDIVQNHYSPKFDEKVLEKIEKLKDFFKVHKVKDHTTSYLNIKDSISKLWKEENQDKLLSILSRIEINLEIIKPSIDLLKDRVKRDYPKSSPPKEWRQALMISDWLKDFHCKIEDYVEIIEKTSSRNIIKNPQGDDEIVFNCLEENYLMHKYFHRWSSFTVLMSATFSDPSVYLKSIALNSAKYIKVPNSFDFSKSPIYFYNGKRMSYKEIDKNLPWLYSKVNEILDKYPKDSGIIHTASYHLTMKIHNNLSKENKKRVLVYSGTEEKRQVLEILKRKKGMVLLGPSLRTGLDLKDDFARFTVVAKIPYASLADKFVATKMKLFPEWYRCATIIEVLQSIGRTVRHEEDWCVTYILDGSLSDLIHRNRRAFPIEFMQRMQVIR